MAKELLERRIRQMRGEIYELIANLTEMETELRTLEEESDATPSCSPYCGHRLSNENITRFSRQLLLPQFGVDGQEKLSRTSFAVVGVGGLGCPAARYLVGAGCEHIGLIDHDEVDKNNLHRQTLYEEGFEGLRKVDVAKRVLSKVNPRCKITTHYKVLRSANTMNILAKYDVVLDCSDNVATRYLVNDACVMLKKPLVFGSALQLDGQLTVYNYNDGPCYRCLYPVPPPSVAKCDEDGVLGPVTGVIGSLQALEAIKIATGMGDVLAGRLLVFDGARGTFRNIKLRGKKPECHVCSPKPIITRLINYEQFCRSFLCNKQLELNSLPIYQRILPDAYCKMREQHHVLLDVRSAIEFAICKLPGAINVPLKRVLRDDFPDTIAKVLEDPQTPVVVCCRRGNDSQLAVEYLRNKYPQHTNIVDMTGGLRDWHLTIDKNFPLY